MRCTYIIWVCTCAWACTRAYDGRTQAQAREDKALKIAGLEGTNMALDSVSSLARRFESGVGGVVMEMEAVDTDAAQRAADAAGVGSRLRRELEEATRRLERQVEHMESTRQQIETYSLTR